LNKPLTLELLYDEPVVGQNRFGNYYLYAVKSGVEEFSFFAPESVHEDLQNFKRGEHAIITKLAANKNGKLITTYSVERPLNGMHPENGKKPLETDQTKTDDAETSFENGDRYYDTMLRSYKDALSINEHLNGLIEVSKVAITLFIARSKLPFNGNGN